ncbi:MAG: hypothetical protein PSU94_06335 [Lacunisphaera sp.]|nr:hypothetical protein [Lacunisphaera sp.]
MCKIMLPSLLLILTAGCTSPVPPAKADADALVRAEAARARYRILQDDQKPKPAAEFVPVRLERGPFTENGISRTGSETLIFVPRLP